MLLGKSHFPFAYFHLPLTTSDGDTDPDPGNVGNPMYTDFRPLPHHIHYSTTSTPLPPTLQARTLEYQPLTQLLFYPQGCYIAAERRILATAYNGKSYTFTSLTTRNTLTSKYLNLDVSGISIPSATNLLPLSPGPKSKPIKATPY